MNFDIESSLSGVRIKGEGKEYFFETKLFSHSSKLLDETSNVVASLTRTGFWRMNFELIADDKKYQLKQRPLETELISSESATRFHTISGLDFFKGSSLATQVEGRGLRARHFKLRIKEPDHWLALLVATCLECSLASSGG